MFHLCSLHLLLLLRVRRLVLYLLLLHITDLLNLLRGSHWHAHVRRLVWASHRRRHVRGHCHRISWGIGSHSRLCVVGVWVKVRLGPWFASSKSTTSSASSSATVRVHEGIYLSILVGVLRWMRPCASLTVVAHACLSPLAANTSFVIFHPRFLPLWWVWCRGRRFCLSVRMKARY